MLLLMAGYAAAAWLLCCNQPALCCSQPKLLRPGLADVSHTRTPHPAPMLPLQGSSLYRLTAHWTALSTSASSRAGGWWGCVRERCCVVSLVCTVPLLRTAEHTCRLPYHGNCIQLPLPPRRWYITAGLNELFDTFPCQASTDWRHGLWAWPRCPERGCAWLAAVLGSPSPAASIRRLLPLTHPSFQHHLIHDYQAGALLYKRRGQARGGVRHHQLAHPRYRPAERCVLSGGACPPVCAWYGETGECMAPWW